MSSFISKALRRVEVALEQVDERVAQASRRLVVEGATDGVEEHADDISSGEETDPRRRPSSIPRAEHRPRHAESTVGLDQSAFAGEEGMPVGDGWGDDVVVDDAELDGPSLPLPGPAPEPATEDDGLRDVDKKAPVGEAGLGVDAVQDDAMLSVDENATQPSSQAVGERNGRGVDPSAMKPPVLRNALPQSGQATPLHAEPEVLEDDKYAEALRTENNELRQELELMDADIDKARREKSKLVKNLKRMKEIVSEMDESLRDKSAEARSLESELITAKDEIASLRTKSRESDARGKDGMDLLRKELRGKIESLQQEVAKVTGENGSLQEENERLKEALLHGNEVDMATADGARQEASQAHRAYEAESLAHRETRALAKEREEALEAEAALATTALATAQRKAEECLAAANGAKTAQRAAETKLATVTSARDAAFARIEDLDETVRMFQRGEGDEAPGQVEAKVMGQTVADLENALEAKNVELNRLEGEVESLRASLKSRHVTSPRTPGQTGRTDMGNHQEVEVKLRHMADSALRKQAQLEVLRSENRALQHQLTTERKRTREAQAMAAAASSSRQSIRGGFRGILDTGDDDRGDRAYGVRDGPLARFRTPRNWPRALSRVITSVDKFSAQALAFLRKEPLLRVVILVYLVAMHVFVYALLHWHVDAVSGNGAVAHASVASLKSGGQIRDKL